MKHALRGCAGLAVLTTLVASAIPAAAHPVNGNLPGGTSITVSIDSPADGSVRPPGPVPVSGTASVGQGQPVPSTALVYTLDVSNSTQTAVTAGCGGDQNGDGDANNILDCEVLAAKTLNNEALSPGTAGTIPEVGAAAFANGATTADVGPAGGEQLITGPATDADGAGGRDINQVLNSAFRNQGAQAGFHAFTEKDVGCCATNFAAGITASTQVAAAASAGLRRLVVFLSDGLSTGEDITGPLNAVPANVDFYTFAVGTASSCTSSGANSLQRIADETGGTCTEVPDVSALPDILPSVINSQLNSLSLRVDGGAPAPITNVSQSLPQDGPVSVSYSVNTAPLGPGTHQICVTANGSDGGGPDSVTDCHTVRINAPPTVDPNGPYSGQEGTAVAIAGAATDPDGPSISTQWTIAPASGVDPGASCTFGNAAALSTTVRCTDDGTYTLTLTASDGFNPPVAVNTTLTLFNVAPAVHFSAPANDVVVARDAPVNFAAPFTDVGTNDSHTCTFDFDDGTPVANGNVSETPGTGTCSGTHAFTVSGTHNVLVTVRDDDGGSATDVVRVIVNSPPVVSAGGPYAGQEGSAVSIAGSVTDPDGPSLTTAWSITPNAGVDAGTTCAFGNAAAVSTTVTCTDDGTFTLRLTANDGLNAPVVASTTLTLTNVAPVVTISTPANGTLFVRGTSVGFTAPFTDAGRNDSHTCTVNFDDGTPVVNGTVTETAGSGTGTCTTSHAFTALGPHNVLVTVRDDDGGVGTAVVRVVIFLPAEAWAISASGVVTIAKTPHAVCPPDADLTQVGVNVPGVANVSALNASCTVDPATGTTHADASVDGASLLGGLISITNIETSCVAGPNGVSGSSRVGTINGQPIGTVTGSISIPLVATVFFNQTVNGPNGSLTQHAIRVVTLLGQEIILAGCRVG